MKWKCPNCNVEDEFIKTGEEYWCMSCDKKFKGEIAETQEIWRKGNEIKI